VRTPVKAYAARIPEVGKAESAWASARVEAKGSNEVPVHRDAQDVEVQKGFADTGVTVEFA